MADQLPAAVAAEAQSLTPSALISLWELDVSSVPGAESEPPFRWCSTLNELGQSVVYNGNAYKAMPISVDGVEVNSQGAQPRPTMSVAAFARGVNGERVSLAAAISSLDYLIGCVVRRIRIHARHLDAVNFAAGNPNADPTAIYQIDEWEIDRLAGDTPLQIDFELANALDMRGVMLPRGQVVAQMCPSRTVYRGPLCRYAGTDYFDANDNPVSDPAKDVCGRRFSSCIARHSVPTTYTYTSDPDIAGYAAEVIAHSQLFNPALTPAAGHTAWPDGWFRRPDGLPIKSVGRSTLSAAPQFAFVDTAFYGVPQKIDSTLLVFSGGNEIAYDARPVGGSYGMFLQIIKGNLAATCSISLVLRCFDTAKVNSGQQVLKSLAPADLGSFGLQWVPFTVGASFDYDYYDPDTGNTTTESAPTAWFRPELRLTVPDSMLPVPADESNVFGYSGETLDFTLRVGMPYIGPHADLGSFVAQQQLVANTIKILPLPFGGFPGAEL